jgi:hypothetical protein
MVNKEMRCEGDSIVQCVEYPTKDGFHGRPAGTPFSHFLGGCGFLTLLGVFGVEWAEDDI